METITVEKDLGRAGFVWREAEGVSALACEPLERAGFSNAFSTRGGGCSAFPENSLNLAGFSDDAAENIRENRRRFLAAVGGADLWTLAACWQVHGADVRAVGSAEDARSREESEQVRCDALVTQARGVLVGVKTADCVPVLLGDARTGACAAVHAGWRGTLARMVARTLGRMEEEYGTRAGDVLAAVGPAALGCCYEVGPEVVEAFEAEFEGAAEWFAPTREGRALADLHRANRAQLEAAGVAPARIHSAPLCTICRPDLFFSYRRDRPVYGRTGRLMSVVGRR
ncbi:MAG TPA: peptidoglycan editing factor PgeF [Pyrinomonadaceae bacterium]|nr:peptidoglycan editing factor PgeF [Pyrinomonadaceae bacterium]